MRTNTIFRMTNHLLLAVVVLALFFGLLTPSKSLAADNKNYPILLIHGLGSDITSWKDFPTFLERRGYKVFVLDFNEWTTLPFANKNIKNFDEISAVIGRQITDIRKATGKEKVNVVAHSIAGIAVRGYIAGWGGNVESRGKYANDINKVLYLATPHYGVSLNSNKMRLLLKNTDYGPFLHIANVMSALQYGSEEVMALHDFFAENGEKLGIEELTVYSKADTVLQNYSANLNAVKIDPFRIPRPGAPGVEDKHITLQQFDHASSIPIGFSKKTILGIAATNHPVLGIATSFFDGQTSWKKYDAQIKGADNTLVYLRVSPGYGLNMSSFLHGSLVLKKVRTATNKKAVKMTYCSDSQTFYFTGATSGTFELSYPPAGDYTFSFDLNLEDGATSVATFDLSNPPFDPELEIQPGDEDIMPGQIPANVNDYKTLRRFVLATFPFESRTYKTGKQMQVIVTKVRNALCSTYTDIAKKNDIDKLGLDEKTTVDFVDGKNEGGILANKLVWLVTVKEDDPPDDGGGGGGGSLPDGISIPDTEPTYVNGLTSLKAFALYHFGAELFEYKTPDIKGICKRLRDKIVGRFDQYFLPWTDSATSHFDAFANRYEVTTIDFASKSSNPGRLYYQLTWIVHYDPLWAK